MSSANYSRGKLQERYYKETNFHNIKYSNPSSGPRHYKVNPTYRIFSEMAKKLGNLEGKRILECGCGTGWVTAELSSLGAKVDAFDISQEAVERTKRRLFEKKLSRSCIIRKLAAEKLDYPDNSFDYVIGFAILHHLDLEKSMAEVYRVLKPSGLAMFAEPLGENPFINFYRKVTPRFRTPDEKPLVFSEFIPYTSPFSGVIHSEIYFTALFPFLLIYLPYFKRFFDTSLRPFLVLDSFLLKKYPFLGRWAWYTILELKK
jgi:ubiquinone/menaquinone biosynthesis C-methylase UbiE